MKKFVVMILVVAFSFNAVAGEVWVTSSALSTRKHLHDLADNEREHNSESEFVSFHEVQIRTPVTRPVLEGLLELETNAQRRYVSGNFNGAFDDYRELRNRLWSVPNVSGIEKITLAALLYSAQLATLLHRKDADIFWRSAHSWAPNVQLPTDEFSPAMIKKFQSALQPKKFPMKISAHPEADIYVDGRRGGSTSDGQHTVLVEAGEHQVCALVPGAVWTCQKVTFDEVRTHDDIQIKTTPVIEGNCEEPHFTGPALPPHVRLLVRFENENCERVYYHRNWYSISGKHVESMISDPTTTFAASLAEPKSSTPLWDKLKRSGWFWAGVSAVALGAVIYATQSQTRETVVVPTQTYK